MKKVLPIIAVLSLLVCGCQKSQPAVELTAISLKQHSILLEKNASKVLEVVLTPSNATNKTLSWSCSNTAVTTVTDGVVVGVAPGFAEIIVKSGDLSDKCQVTVVVPATSITVEPSEITLAPGETASLTVAVQPEDATDEVEWSSSDEKIVTVKNGVVTAVAAGNATVTAKAGTCTASCSIVVSKMKVIDLGLSVKWGTCNLGASSPEEYGDYYAWGEVGPNMSFNWESYKWANGDGYKLTKYCPDNGAFYWDAGGDPDGKTVLDPEDDVAHVNLGGKLRLPTDAEWTELRTTCTWAWTSDYMGTGVGGYIIMGPNENSIFLPAAGYWIRAKLTDEGFRGLYWSSLLNTDDPLFAWGVDFNFMSWYRWYFYRYTGLSVRPVSE